MKAFKDPVLPIGGNGCQGTSGERVKALAKAAANAPKVAEQQQARRP
jgi:hypothetical protein